MLPSRIQAFHPHPAPPASSNPSTSITPPSPSSSAEDLLSSFLPHLFPDEAPSCLGSPGQNLVYASLLFGQIRVIVPDYSDNSREEWGDEKEDGGVTTGLERDAEASRKLFAHYLWGGALVIAERIEEAERLRMEGADLDADAVVRSWSASGQKVLEVGAGAALPSIIAALAGADSVTITDHPDSAALKGSVKACIAQNISSDSIRKRVSVHPHEWGVFSNNSPDDKDHTTLSFAAEHKHTFTRIICADCLWMQDQHENLVRSLLWFLAPSCKKDDRYEGGGLAWVVGGFHTGREIVASFFETATSMGMIVEDIYERDVNATSEMGEVTRPWMPVREGEGPENRARWCVVALLRAGGG